MQKAAFFRFLTCILICVSIVLYNFLEEKTDISISVKGEIATDNISFFDDSFPASNEPQKVEKEEEKPATQVSAEAVKGNIISKYISPYSAGLSYDGVYVKNCTSLDINLKNILNSKLNFTVKKSAEPQILIIHTHTTETFMPTDSSTYGVNFNARTTDNTKNMAHIGDILTERLNGAGIKTIHDKTQHDYPEYTGSYSRAATTINSYLKKYPSIKIVLDLHRDSVSSGANDKVKLVTEINGKKAAQVMLVMGSQSGGVTNYPNWKENFKLAVKIQHTIEKMYPTLARPIMLMSKNYNQSLSQGAVLIEFGTDANSLSEAEYSAELVSDSLIVLFNSLGA